jgi:hypothetical protein
MNQVSEDREVQCPSCGFTDSGNYCSKCGAELAPRSHGAFLHFVDSFLRISEIKSYATMFITILSSPTKNVIAYYEEGDARKAFQFLGYSATLWFLIALSRIWVIREHDLIATIIFTLQFVITLSISIPIFYKLSVRKSPHSRTFHDFLIISSLYVGVNIVLTALITYIQLIEPLVGLLASVLVLIPIAIYTVRVLKYFWGLSTGKILFNAVVSSFAGGAAGILFLVLCANIFNIRVQGF